VPDNQTPTEVFAASVRIADLLSAHGRAKSERIEACCASDGISAEVVSSALDHLQWLGRVRYRSEAGEWGMAAAASTVDLQTARGLLREAPFRWREGPMPPEAIAFVKWTLAKRSVKVTEIQSGLYSLLRTGRPTAAVRIEYLGLLRDLGRDLADIHRMLA